MKLNRLFVPATVGVVAISAFGLSKNGQAAPPIVMGYYPEYRDYMPPQTLRLERFTHIIHSFVRTDDKGKVKVAATLPSKSLTEAAHAKGVKVLLGLSGGSDGDNFGKMARDTTLRAAYIADVVKLMADNGYDGLVIDWEVPEAADRDVLVDFVSQMKRAMHAAKPDAVLGMAVPAQKGNSHGFDGPRLNKNIDFLNVMTYDYHGPWSHAGHNAALFNVASDTDGAAMNFQSPLEFWRDVQGFRTDQITFGIAGYGRGFKVKAWGEKPTGESQYPEISFGEAKALIGKGWTRQWDAEAKTPWLLKDDKTDRISYDDEQSIADKSNWMKQNGLSGFFIWEITQEFVEGDHVLTATALKAWNDAPVAKK